MKQEKMLASFDGTKLFTRTELPAKMKALVVIVHGLAEHLGRYDALTERLLSAGYGVYRYDQRGHARSEGPRTFFSDFNEMPDDCKFIVDTAKAEHPGLPVYLIGHSMGGFTVAAFGTKYPGQVAGIVTSGALTRYTQPTFGELPVAAPVDTYLENALGEGVCTDQEVVKAYQADPLVEKEISIGLVNALWEGITWLKAHPTQFTDPTLILHGCDDGLVAEQDSRDFYGEIASTDKTLKIYANLYHEIFNEPVKQEIFTEVIHWLDNQG